MLACGACVLSLCRLTMHALSRGAGLRYMLYLATLAFGVCVLSRQWLAAHAFSRGADYGAYILLRRWLSAHIPCRGMRLLQANTHTALPLTYQPHPRAGYPHIHDKTRALATAYPHGDMQTPLGLMHMFMTKRTAQCRHIPALPAICTPASTFCRNFIHSRDDMCMRLFAP